MKDYTDYINNLLSDFLPPDQKEKFRSQHLINEKLREQYYILLNSREYIIAKSGLEEIENDPDLHLAEQLVNDFYEGKEDIQPRAIRLKPLWIILISTAAMIVFILLAKSTFFTSPNERVYNRYYQPLNKANIEMEFTRGISIQHYHDGLESYLVRDFEAALKSFSFLAGASYYQGLSLLGMDEFEEAIQQFEYHLIQHPYHPGANWYLALAYLQRGRYDQAILKLEELTKSENPYRSSSGKLIVRIGKIKAAGGN